MGDNLGPNGRRVSLRYIFNVADSAISIGVFMIVLDQFRGLRRSEAG
jgi:lipoprotein signal peptidase